MLGVTPAKLRAEWAALRPGPRALMVALMVWMVFAVVATCFALGLMRVPLSTVAPAAGGPVSRGPKSYEAIVQRPLFAKTRQPSALAMSPTAAGDSGPAAVMRNVTLRGVYRNGEVAKAYLVVPPNPVGVWRQRNEEVAGWRVLEIANDHVVLGGATDRFTVPLSIGRGQ